MKKTILISAFCALLSACAVAFATQTNYLGTVFIADTTTPANQLKVNADGSINVSGGGGGTVTTPSVVSPAPVLVPGSTTTRPADTNAYSFGDLVANSTTAGSVTCGTLTLARAVNQPGLIQFVRLIVSSTVLTNAQFRIHFYNVCPTFSNGDNAAWLTTSAGYLGSVDVTVDRAFSDAAEGIGGPSAGAAIPFTPAAGTQTVDYVIEARAAYTPTSAETFTPNVQMQ